MATIKGVNPNAGAAYRLAKKMEKEQTAKSAPATNKQKETGKAEKSPSKVIPIGEKLNLPPIASSGGNTAKTAVEKYGTPTTAEDIVSTSKKMAQDSKKRTKALLGAAQKEYQDYLKSDERQKNRAKAEEEQRQLNFAFMDSTSKPTAEDEKEKTLRAKVDYYRSMADAEDNQRVTDTNLREFEAWDEADKRALAEYAVGKETDYFDSINAAQNGIKIGNAEQKAAALFEKYGKERVDEIAESWKWRENQKNAQEVTEAAQEGAGGSVGGAIGHSAASVGANLAGGLAGLMGYMYELGNRTGQYKTLDPNNAGTLLNTYSGAVRGEVAQNIAGDEYDENGEKVKEGGWWRDALSVGYQGVMSAADSIARSVVAGGTGGAVLAATGSFTQAVSDASKQGATPTQAVIQGVATAGVEALSEKIPLDNLIKTAKGGKQSVGAILKNAFKQAGVEATSEEISLFCSLLAEAAILQEKSGYNREIADLVANGMSYAEAKQQASRTIFNEAVQTAFVSAASGGISSAGAGVFANLKAIRQAKREPQTVEMEQLPESERIKNSLMDGMAEMGKKAAENQQPAPEMTEGQKLVDRAAAELFGVYEEPESTVFTEEEEATRQRERAASLEDSNVPPVTPEQYPGESDNAGIEDPFDNRDWNEVGKKSVKAYMYENPEVKPFFQMEAQNMLMELNDTIRGERGYNDQQYYESGGESGWYGVKRHTSEEIGTLLDSGFSYDQIERGLKAIIEDNGAENNAVSKRIEFVLNDRLLNGHKDFYSNDRVPASEGYINLVNEKQINEYSKESFEKLMESAENYVPPVREPDSTPYMDAKKQSAEGGQIESIKGTGAAERNFTGTAAYEELLSDDNVQRARKGDVRSEEVPKVDVDGRIVSEFVSNSMNSALTPDSFTSTIKQLVQDGKVSHDVQSNEQSLREAAEDIAKGGSIYRSVQEVSAIAQSGKTSVKDVAKAELLYNHLVNQDDRQSQEMAADVYVTLAQLATNSGRSTQMFSLFRKMTPDGQVMALQQEVTRNVEKMKKAGQVKKNYEPQIDPQMLQEYRKAAVENKKAKTPEAQSETAEQMKLWEDAILTSEAAKMPATFKAKWDAWRYMAMLGNVKTQARNIVGNAAFKPYKAVKDTMAAAFEKAFVKQDQRTKSVLTFSEGDRQLTEWAKVDAKSEGVRNALKYSAKLGDDVTSSVMDENKQVFNTKALDNVRKFVEKVPGAGDMLFKNGYYEKSMAGFLKARGYTAADIEAGKVSDTVLNEGRTYAIDEAMKATFNDSNAFSDFISSVGRSSNDNAWAKAFNTAVEGVLPFRRTPANIMVRMAEYSPAGIAKGLWNAATKVRNGEMSAATAVDQLAAGLTGSGAMALGYFLASGAFGIKLRGSEVSEDEERQGHQDYAIEFSVGGKEYSYKIDWAAPANMPLFMGANIYSLVQDSGEDASLSAFTSAIYAMGTMFEPMLSLSCMSSLNDLVEGMRYAGEGEALYTIATQMATSYFTQGVPSLARQTAQAFQETKQSTFANSSDPLTRDIQRTAAGIPFVGSAYQVDSVDEWGQTESKGGFLLRAFNSYINPGTMKSIDNGALEQEILRLGGSQPESVSPPSASKTISFTDSDGERHSNQRLTAGEYKNLATIQGQTAKTILDSMIESDSYKALTDEQKAGVFEYVYDFAREKARAQSITGYPKVSGWMNDIAGKTPAEQANYIIKKSMTASFSDAFSDITEAWNNDNAPAEAVASLEQAFQVYDNMSQREKNVYRSEAGGRLGYFLEAKNVGIKTDTFLDLYKEYREIDENKNLDIGQKAQEWSYVLEKAQNSRTLTETQKNVMKRELVFRYNMTAETKKFDEMVEDGISTDSANKIIQLMDGIVGTGAVNKGTNERTVTNADKWNAIANESGLSGSELDAVMKAYMPDYDPTDESPTKTELKYDYARQELGLTASQFVEAYKVESDGGKKAEKLASWRELGYTAAEANMFYRLFSATGRTKIDVVSWHEGQ